MTTVAEKAIRAGSAGRRGADVRSDCWAEVEVRGSGGIELSLTSKVESMYGAAIRRQVGEVLAGLGVTNARVTLEDAGALPFVIAARLEAAVRRAGVTPGEGWLPPTAKGTEHPTRRERFRRSRLYLPGNEPKFMLNAGLHRPDGVILDLEDSVAPPEKDAARILVRNALRSIDFCGSERMVRINQGERGLEDLDFVAPHNLHVVLIPKVEDADQVRAVEARVDSILGGRRRAGGAERTDEQIFLMPIIESAKGAIKAYDIALSSKKIVALAIGLEDYTADLGVARTPEGHESFWMRGQVINAARAAGIQPIDTVFSDVADMDGLRASVLEAKSLGFDGKGCIHPRQIAVIHEAFAPSEQELEKARRIVAAFEEAQARGLGVVALGSKMIDPPVVKRALRVVELARMQND